MAKILFSKPKLTLWGFFVTVAVIVGHSSTTQAQSPLSQPIQVPPSTGNFPVEDSQGYTLGPGDLLQLDIFNVPEYSGNNGQHQVGIDGSVNLPLIGNLVVKGLTLDQVTAIVQQRYGEYLQRPLLTVQLLAPRPLQIAVTGEVQRPGSYMLSASTDGPWRVSTNTPEVQKMGGRLPTITRVLQMAGGITPSADVRQVKIRRSLGNGGEKILNLDLWELVQTGDLRQDITLRDGDTIYIPTATEHNALESSQLVTANFASNTNQPINVAVVGAVNRPGTHTLRAELIPQVSPEPGQLTEGVVSTASGGILTVTQALKVAGGITSQADIRNIQVRRLTRTGTEQHIQVDLWKLLQEGDVTQDAMLQQGDTIIVPTATTAETEENAEVAAASFSPDTLKISIVGEVVSPGAKSVAPNTSLNQALVEAGGFNESRANKKEVELIRLHPNGTVSRRPIPINLSAEVNEETNPKLRNNDVIVVGRSGGASFRDGLGTVLNSLSPINNFLGLFRFVNIF
ncbi:SLBB domain-containing protein [Planktothrix sp. FACHB-1365]|uniref:SLBB domain-containing protein n=1 Tax=Planktothrix sp. FACHB-1365 TaxID=2692855 RepID=UPI001684E8FA|nr:SLBB domain-containing protein [Planktothrix sp. FACHB-1365]MBD2482232.1 SLBB domain-containing protein [Planktothrix sp. FACHB-1365]